MEGIINKNGITIKQLKDLIKDWPEVDEYGSPYEIWIDDGHGLSNACKEICQLNQGDIIFGIN